MENARVESHLVVSATDAASVALGQTRKSIKTLGEAAQTAGKQGKAASDDFKKVGETSGDLESALKGVSDFSGAQAGAVSKVGDAFGAVEAVTRLLPGQLGLAATAIGGLAVGAYMLTKHLSESAAKVRLLTSSEGRRLGESFQAGTDEVVKLSAALDSLGERSLRPSDELLKRVRDNAIAVGADGADAVAKFIEVWKQGPKAINDNREAINALGGKVDDLAKTAKSLGLDPKSLGLVETVATADKFKTTLSEVALNSRQLEIERKKLLDLEEKFAKAGTSTMGAIVDQINQTRRLIAEKESVVATDREHAKFLGQKLSTELETAQVSKQIGEIQNEANGKATQARTKQIGLGIQLAGIEQAQEVVVKAIAREQELIARGTGKEAEDRKKVLEGLLAQLGVRQAGILAGDKAAKAQASQSGAAEAAARRTALVDASLRRQKALADVDGVRSIEERIALIDAETTKELGALDRKRLGRAGLAAATEAIELERQAKVRQAETEVGAERAKVESELAAAIIAGNERSAAIVVQLADVRAQRTAQAAEREASALEQTGQVDAAVAVRRTAAAQAYADEVQRINREINASQAQLAVGSEDRANLELVRLARLSEAADAKAQKELALAAKQLEAMKATVQASASAFAGPLAKLGDGKVGKTLGALASGVGSVASSWTGMKEAAPGAIAALGNVATATDESLTVQSIKQALFQTAAGIASLAIGDAPGASNHFSAAAAYGIVAGTNAVMGTGAGTGAAATGGSGTGPSGFDTVTGNASGGSAGAQGKTEVYNFYAPLGTPQAIGKEINRNSRSLDRTGFARSRGK